MPCFHRLQKRTLPLAHKEVQDNESRLKRRNRHRAKHSCQWYPLPLALAPSLKPDRPRAWKVKMTMKILTQNLTRTHLRRPTEPSRNLDALRHPARLPSPLSRRNLTQHRRGLDSQTFVKLTHKLELYNAAHILYFEQTKHSIQALGMPPICEYRTCVPRHMCLTI